MARASDRAPVVCLVRSSLSCASGAAKSCQGQNKIISLPMRSQCRAARAREGTKQQKRAFSRAACRLRRAPQHMAIDREYREQLTSCILALSTDDRQLTRTRLPFPVCFFAHFLKPLGKRKRKHSYESQKCSETTPMFVCIAAMQVFTYAVGCLSGPAPARCLT
jgi:hypothetical protein